MTEDAAVLALVHEAQRKHELAREAAAVVSAAFDELARVIGRERAWLAIVFAAQHARGDVETFAVEAWRLSGLAEKYQRAQGAQG